MVSRDLPHSMVSKQIAFDQRDLHSTPVFESALDRHCQTMVSKLETLDPSLLPNCLENQEVEMIITCLV